MLDDVANSPEKNKNYVKKSLYTYPWKKRAPRSTTQKKKGREVMELGCASNLGAR